MEWAEKIQKIEIELGIQNDRGQLAKLIGIRPGAIADIKTEKPKIQAQTSPCYLSINRELTLNGWKKKSFQYF
jgi:hypothetical protein